MEIIWRRSIFSVFLILSLNFVHVFSQNVSPCGSPSLLNNEINRECSTVNINNSNPQLMNTLLTVAAANGVLPDMLSSLGPVLQGNQQPSLLQEGITQQQALLPLSIPYSQGTSTSLTSSGLLNTNSFLPSPRVPVSLPSASCLPPPIVTPPILPGTISHGMPALSIQPPSSGVGIVRPIFNRQQSSSNSLSESSITEVDTVSTNSVSLSNSAVKPTQPSLLQQLQQQKIVNQLASNNFASAQSNIKSDVNQISSLSTQQLNQLPSSNFQCQSSQSLSSDINSVSAKQQLSNPFSSNNFQTPQKLFPEITQVNPLLAKQQLLNQLTTNNGPITQSNLVSEVNQVNSLASNQVVNQFASNNFPTSQSIVQTEVNQLNQLSTRPQLINQCSASNFPVTQPILSEVNHINQFGSTSYPAVQSTLLTEINQINPLLNQQINPCVYNDYPSQPNLLSRISPLPIYPVIYPSPAPYGIFQPGPMVCQQPQLINPNTYLPIEATTESEVSSEQSTTIQATASAAAAASASASSSSLSSAASSAAAAASASSLSSAAAESEVEVATISSATTQQSAMIDESSQQLPLNLLINIPPMNLPAPSVTFITSPSNPTAPVNAPTVPSFGGYPSIQPIIIEGSKSKLRTLLPIILVALLSNDGYSGGGCSCCGPCNCGSSNIPIPYPIPIPCNNPIILD